jgi:transposase
LLIPNVAKTWAPIGETPIIHHPYRRDKVSVISGVSVSPQRQRLSLYYFLFYDNIGQEEVCLFFRHLLRHLHGKMIVLLDNSTTHKGQPLEELLHRHPRLHVEYFPAYAPELNPDEGVWCQAKRELANSCPKDFEELTADIIQSMNQIGQSQSKLRGCIEQSELPTFLH